MSTQGSGLIASIYSFLLDSPLNTGLTVICAYLIYRIFRSDPKRESVDSDSYVVPPPLEKHNMTYEELKKYDGKGPDGRICIAICGKVIDCSKGRRFYGPGGPYSTFAGRDATRALATFNVLSVKDDYDDISDLSASQLASSEEWLMQYMERYDLVGDLVHPGKAAEADSKSSEAHSGDNADSSSEEKSKDK